MGRGAASSGGGEHIRSLLSPHRRIHVSEPSRSCTSRIFHLLLVSPTSVKLFNTINAEETPRSVSGVILDNLDFFCLVVLHVFHGLDKPGIDKV